jgi:CHAT domain-containing protein
LQSAILLAEGGALTVSDLVGMRLDKPLVVLSACETGVGQTTAGDELLGLTRGLLAAGARAAVVSLWSVDDHSTSLLMAGSTSVSTRVILQLSPSSRPRTTFASSRRRSAA